MSSRFSLAAGSPGSSALATRRRRISRQEFLVFNQELATLLKAGMPLTQSLDILRQRVENPTFKAVLDGVYEKVQSGTALSDAFSEHGDLFPAVYSASLLAGERSGNLDSVIRRYVAYEKLIGAARTADDLGADLSRSSSMTMMVVLVGIIVLQGDPGFLGLLRHFRPATATVDPGHRWVFERRRLEYPGSRSGRHCPGRRGGLLVPAAVAEGPSWTGGCSASPGSGRPPGSSLRLRSRGCSRRCWAGVFRWSIRSRLLFDRLRTDT